MARRLPPASLPSSPRPVYRQTEHFLRLLSRVLRQRYATSAMAGPTSFQFPPHPEGLTVRDATPEDNDALIRLELESPLVMGDIEIAFDRAPDFLARHRLHPGCRVVVGEMDGRLVGIVAGVIHRARIGGQSRLVQYIHQGRIHRSAQRRGVASALSLTLLKWGREQGAETPYWFIGENNAASMAFGGRGGGKWSVPVTFRDYQVADASATPASRVPPEQLSATVALINAAHEGQEFFEPFTAESFAARLSQDPQYGPDCLRGVIEDGRLVAVAGLWDEGALVTEVRLDRSTGEVRRSSVAAVLDWGWAPGREDAFAALLRSLAAEARALGRDALTMCEPAPGALPDPGLPSRSWSLNIFTPAVYPPAAEDVKGIFVDLVYF